MIWNYDKLMISKRGRESWKRGKTEFYNGKIILRTSIKIYPTAILK